MLTVWWTHMTAWKGRSTAVAPVGFDLALKLFPFWTFPAIWYHFVGDACWHNTIFQHLLLPPPRFGDLLLKRGSCGSLTSNDPEAFSHSRLLLLLSDVLWLDLDWCSLCSWQRHCTSGARSCCGLGHWLWLPSCDAFWRNLPRSRNKGHLDLMSEWTCYCDLCTQPAELATS